MGPQARGGNHLAANEKHLAGEHLRDLLEMIISLGEKIFNLFTKLSLHSAELSLRTVVKSQPTVKARGVGAAHAQKSMRMNVASVECSFSVVDGMSYMPLPRFRHQVDLSSERLRLYSLAPSLLSLADTAASINAVATKVLSRQECFLGQLSPVTSLPSWLPRHTDSV